MANETLITDLVAQEALDQLEALDKAMEETLNNYKDIATEMAKGLKIPVEVQGDLDKLKQVYETQMQRAGQATQQLTNIQRQQAQVIANTTNTISRQLQEQEKLNKAQREAFTQNQRALDVADQVLGSREDNYRMMAKYTAEMKNLKDAMKRLDQEEKNGMVTTEQAVQRRASLMAEYDKVKAASQDLARILSVENKEANAASGSYQQLSQQLERLKQAQKQMNESEKASAAGKALEEEIKNLNARLVDLAADMGEFQRNVGNYAIAGESMRSHLKELTETIARLTMEYEALDDAEKKGEIGQALRGKIVLLTEEAGKFRDTINDVKESIGHSASDTRWLDTLLDSGQLLTSTFALAKDAAISLGISEDTLQQSMLKLQQAMVALSSLQALQNVLQKQSTVMKGIAIMQHKAETIAINIKTAAEGKNVIVTKAATVAQQAFNAVAKANPYVLLATGILALIGIVVGYTTATKDATKADEEAAKAAELRKESMDNMAQSVGNSAGEMIAKYKLLREQWNALGNDINAKRQYLLNHKDDFDKVAEAADGAGAKVNGYKDAEDLMSKSTAKVEAAIMRRARAMAAYAEYIRLTQLELQELEKLSSTNTYKSYKAGDTVTLNEARKAGIKINEAQARAAAQNIDGNGVIVLTEEQAQRMLNFARGYAIAEGVNAMKEIREKYAKQREIVKAELDRNGGFAELASPANFRGGGKTGGSNSSSPGKNSDKVKDAEEIQAILDKILLDGYKAASEMEDKYTDKWVEKERARIEQERKMQEEEANKKAADLALDIKKSKMSEEEKSTAMTQLENATADIIKGINAKAAEELKAIDEEVLEHKRDLADKELEKVEHESEKEIAEITNRNAIALEELRKRYLVELQEAGRNEKKIADIKERYARESAKLAAQNAIDVAQATVDGLEKAAKVENLSDEERERIARDLAKAKIALEEAMNAAVEINLDDSQEKEKKAYAERMKNIQDWVQKVGEAVSAVSDLFSAMYDNQISKIEEQMEAEQEHHDTQIASIEELAERGAITTEEAELRKREAEAATAAKQEQLEKRKAQIEYKKAVMEKANSIAQIGIATALGIMQALAMWPPNIPLAAFVGAMGAIQIATALAQPIKAYKEGTKGKPHPGGLAVVGDGGQAELVAYGRRVWITPDTPTLVDLPKGAEVFPQVTEGDLALLGASLPTAIPRDKTSGMPVIINDYSTLESRVAANTKAITKALSRHEKALTRELKNQRFAAYLARRL